MDLSDIGRRVYGFSLVYSIIITIIVVGLVSAGLPPESLNSPLFLPSSRFYSAVNDIASNIPKNATLSGFLLKAGGTLVTVLLQFSFTLLFGLIALVQSLAYIIPQQYSFLIPPLFFIGSFLQFIVWYYIITEVLSRLRSILPA